MNEGSQSPEGYESCNDIIEVLKSPIVFHALKDMYTQAGNKGELILISQEGDEFLRKVFRDPQQVSNLLNIIRGKYVQVRDHKGGEEPYDLSQVVAFILSIRRLVEQYGETPATLENINMSVIDLITASHSKVKGCGQCKPRSDHQIYENMYYNGFSIINADGEIVTNNGSTIEWGGVRYMWVSSPLNNSHFIDKNGGIFKHRGEVVHSIDTGYEVNGIKYIKLTTKSGDEFIDENMNVLKDSDGNTISHLQNKIIAGKYVFVKSSVHTEGGLMNYEGCVYANRYKIHSRGTVYVIPEGYYEADGDCMYANVNPPFFEFKRIDFMNEEASLNHSKHVKITGITLLTGLGYAEISLSDGSRTYVEVMKDGSLDSKILGFGLRKGAILARHTLGV